MLPTPRIALFVRPSGTKFAASYLHACTCIMDTCIMDTCIMDTCIMDTCIMDKSAWVTRPERPKGAKDEVKEARRTAD